jgi:flagellar M-ring protein FliF
VNRTKKKVVNNQYELNKTTSNLIEAAGGLRRLSAAVFINTRSEGTGPGRKPADRSKEELEKLRSIVRSALGIQENDPTRTITLEQMPFNDQPAIEVAQQLEKQEKKDFWLGLGGKALYPLAALGVFFVFWRLLRRTPGEVIPLGVPVGDLGNGNGNGNGYGGKEAPVVTVEVLNQLIRENPNNMTQAIRAWAGRGSGASN